jgi:Na+-translocating ferredoxin:NAD+ oxidoreductase subunit E
MRFYKELIKGLWTENPVFRIVLGMCPILAITTSVNNAVGMGLAAMFVLICSNTVISAVRNIVPGKVRIPCYIVIIATFVTVVDLLMNAFAHELHKALGIFIPLIVVNCIILGRAEAFASKNSVWLSLADGIGMGIGFTLALIVVAAVREILGNATLLGYAVGHYQVTLLMVLPPGGFLTLGCLLALMNHIQAALALRGGHAYTPQSALDCRHCMICKWGAEEKQ